MAHMLTVLSTYSLLTVLSLLRDCFLLSHSGSLLQIPVNFANLCFQRIESGQIISNGILELFIFCVLQLLKEWLPPNWNVLRLCRRPIPNWLSIFSTSSVSSIEKFTSPLLHLYSYVIVRLDGEASNEEAVRIKEQSILELGKLLSNGKKVAGKWSNSEKIISITL